VSPREHGLPSNVMAFAVQSVQSVAVYCGSSPGTDPAFVRDAVVMGNELVRRGLRLIYGGGRVGLMGAVADSVLANGGHAHGVITRDLLDAEVGHVGLSELEVVDSMHARKARMGELADAFIALPGGFGTWEELTEMLTWTQLGIQRKPVAVCNTNGFWDSLIAQTERAVHDGFVKAHHGQILRVGHDPVSTLDALLDPVPLPTPKWAQR
jgi:uncharacterized protein (TIGR00730 family)